MEGVASTSEVGLAEPADVHLDGENQEQTQQSQLTSAAASHVDNQRRSSVPYARTLPPSASVEPSNSVKDSRSGSPAVLAAGSGDPVVTALLGSVASSSLRQSSAVMDGNGGGDHVWMSRRPSEVLSCARGTAADEQGDGERGGLPTGSSSSLPASHAKRQRALDREKLLPSDHRMVIHAVTDAVSSRSKRDNSATKFGSRSSSAVARREEDEGTATQTELSEGSRWGYGAGSSTGGAGNQHQPRDVSSLFSPLEGLADDEVDRHRSHSMVDSSNSSTRHEHARGGSWPDDGSYTDKDDISVEVLEELLRRLGAVQQWTDSYRRAFAPAYPPYEHVLGIVNPLSGENNAAALVERGMLAELGSERVVLLNGTIFGDPSILRKKMKEQAFFYHDPTPDTIARLSALLRARREAGADDERTAHRVGGATATSGPTTASVEPVAATSVAVPRLGEPPGSSGGSSKYVDVDGAVIAEAKDGKAILKEAKREARRASTSTSVADTAFTRERGTVIISGGDGTVSFIMDQVHLARREIEAELRQLLKPEVPLELGSAHPGRSHLLHIDTGAGSDELPPPAPPLSEAEDGGTAAAKASGSHTDRFLHLLDVKRYYTMPAVAPIPMGTGNDYSNCVGFGSGFTYYRGFGFCCCCESDVAKLLGELVAAPSVPFDRWTADFVPLRVAQENLRPVPQSRNGEAAAPGTRPLEPNMANTVHHVDWERIHNSPGCVSFTITNYLGVGFDAYVTTQFARARKAYPALCSSRMQNKALFGVFGVRGGVNCRTIRNLLPMVCVPSPWSAPPSPGAGQAARTTALSRGKPEMVALQLPSSCKALVMTNVSRYSSGKQPWKPKEGELYYHPVELSYREEVVHAQTTNTTAAATSGSTASPTGAASGHWDPLRESSASPVSVGVPEDRIIPARTATHRPPIITPVAINDRKFELQTMGGVLSYATLGLGLTSATKMTQTGEMFIFALCTPDDLRYERAGGISSPFSRRQMAKYQQRLSTDPRVRASLNVQIDGEAIPRITEPTVVHVYPMAPDRIYVRCRNPEVVRRASADDSVTMRVE